MKAIVGYLGNIQGTTPPQVQLNVGYEDGAGTLTPFGQDVYLAGVHSWEAIRQILVTTIIANAPSTITEDDIQWSELMVKSFATPTRSLNSAFQIHASRDAQVNYSVDIASTLSLTTGQTGTVTLEYADDSGFTTNVKTVQSSANGNTGTLAIGLNLVQISTSTVSGIIPAGKYAKLVTANTTGTPTFTFKTAQEVLL